MSSLNRMREYIITWAKFHKDRDAIRMDRLTKRPAEDNTAELDRLKKHEKRPKKMRTK